MEMIIQLVKNEALVIETSQFKTVKPPAIRDQHYLYRDLATVSVGTYRRVGYKPISQQRQR